MSDNAALIAEAREQIEVVSKTDGRIWYGLVARLTDALEAVQQEVVALTAEADRAIDQANNLAGDLAVQQAPAVDTGKAVKAIWEALWPGMSGVMDDAELGQERARVVRILFALTGSGILQDAAEVEARGLESFGFWLLDIGHMTDLGRANMKFLVERFVRAQQIQEGTT